MKAQRPPILGNRVLGKPVTDENAPDDTAPTQFEFHFIKSNFFRVVHVDGGIGGLTGRGYCHIALYNERAAIPKLMVRDIMEKGELSPERTQEVLGDPNFGVVREVEVDLMLGEQAVRDLHEWFGRRVKDFDDLKSGGEAVEVDDGEC